jgi:hypothetical protein
MYHYVYYSYESWGRGYIGVRSSKVPPQEDSTYFGSFYDKTFKPANKIIIQTFATREEALEAEILLHSFYCVDKNKHFANLARQTTVKFVSSGKRSDEFRRKVSERMKGRKLTPEHIRKVSEARSKKLKGRKFSEEHKKKISQALKGKMSGIKRGKEIRKTSRQIVLKDVKTSEIYYFDSISRASEKTGIARSNIYHMIKKPHLVNKGYKLVLKDS